TSGGAAPRHSQGTHRGFVIHFATPTRAVPLPAVGDLPIVAQAVVIQVQFVAPAAQPVEVLLGSTVSAAAVRSEPTLPTGYLSFGVSIPEQAEPADAPSRFFLPRPEPVAPTSQVPGNPSNAETPTMDKGLPANLGSTKFDASEEASPVPA